MKKIFTIGVFGMKHCGSTMIFSVLNSYFTHLDFQVVNPCHVFNNLQNYLVVESLTEADCVSIFKHHSLYESVDVKVSVCVLPIRDVRDISISSFFRFRHGNASISKAVTNPLVLRESDNPFLYGLYYFIEVMNDNIQFFLQWYFTMESPVVIKYEDMMKNKLTQFIKILTRVKNHVPDQEILLRCIDDQETIFRNKTNLPKDLEEFSRNKDCVNILLQDHDTSGGKTEKYLTFFSPYQREMILRDSKILSFLRIFGYQDT